ALVDDLLRRLAEIAIRVLLHPRDDELLVERAGVHADAHRPAVLDRDGANHRELLVAASAGADVAGIDAVLVERARAVGISRQQWHGISHDSIPPSLARSRRATAGKPFRSLGRDELRRVNAFAGS